MTPMTSRHAFISFSSQDEKRAHAICDELGQRQVACWFSARDVRPGRNYQSEINGAIRNASHVVLVFSDNANRSEEVARELSLASKNKVPICPVRIKDVEPSGGMEFMLATSQWVDAFDDWHDAMNRLAAEIVGLPMLHLKAPSRKRRRFLLLGLISCSAIAAVAAAVFATHATMSGKAISARRGASPPAWQNGNGVVDTILPTRPISSPVPNKIREADAGIDQEKRTEAKSVDDIIASLKPIELGARTSGAKRRISLSDPGAHWDKDKKVPDASPNLGKVRGAGGDTDQETEPSGQQGSVQSHDPSVDDILAALMPRAGTLRGTTRGIRAIAPEALPGTDFPAIKKFAGLLHCAHVVVSAGGADKISISGYVENAKNHKELVNLARYAASSQDYSNLAVLPYPFCAVHGLATALGANTQTGVNINHPGGRYVIGDILSGSFTTGGDGKRWMQADLIGSDGSVAHLLPAPRYTRTVKAGKRLTFGAPLNKVGYVEATNRRRPLILLVIASDKPLPQPPRAFETAHAYLPRLKDDLAKLGASLSIATYDLTVAQAKR